MYSYPVTYPLEKLLGTHKNKDIKTAISTLANPILSWLIWIGISAFLLPKVWRVIVGFVESGGLYLVLEPDNWGSLIYATLIINAVVLLLFVSFLFNLSLTKNAIRIWKANTVPTAKEYGVSDGFHFGEGTIEIKEDGIALIRSKYRALFHWSAIAEFFNDGSFIGLVTTEGTKLNFGYVKDDDKARHFMDQATKNHEKAISQS